ncbi:MAG: response regulator [Leptolyngbyaceae bacterium]|nr:response regulator [Leptolyngbyaceae bacterium]
MVSTDIASGSVCINEFTADKQVKLFSALREQQFSGQIKLKYVGGLEWVFYLFWGRLVYATGGEHAVRRWRRYVSRYCPDISLEPSILTFTLSQCTKDLPKKCWEYQLLSYWHQKGKIDQKQAAQVISSVMVEVLFDVTQVSKVHYEVHSDNILSSQLVLINAEQVIQKSEKLWKSWKEAKLADRSPNLAPIIKSPTELQKRAPSNIYQTFSKLLDGQQTFRDLGNRLNRDVLAVTQSFLPYIQSGLISLTDIPDLASPVVSKTRLQQEQGPQAPLIACVDDSPAVCKSMETILGKFGYRVVSIQDPLRAIATLLARKPDLIFLDLVMPNTNGYEICGNLRRLPGFRDTPIIILTGNDGVVDRIRAKMVGASAFLSKPVEISVVLELVKKQLSQK